MNPSVDAFKDGNLADLLSKRSDGVSEGLERTTVSGDYHEYLDTDLSRGCQKALGCIAVT